VQSPFADGSSAVTVLQHERPASHRDAACVAPTGRNTKIYFASGLVRMCNNFISSLVAHQPCAGGKNPLSFIR
jgi:hypothetical protein